MQVGIEAVNVYTGAASIGVEAIFRARGLNLQRFDNLMMREKAVALPWEDPVTHAVNAARPIIEGLTPAERDRIDMVITASESGIDFGKSLSTYVHHHLGLDRHCRLFEVKQACYGATAALVMAASYVLANGGADRKVLVVATDVSRTADEVSYAEPSQGSGAVALLIGATARVLELDYGASGTFGYEVMDTCRPGYDRETGDPDLSLYSYLDCLEQCFAAYSARVENVDVMRTFASLIFHTPFAGLVKGAHRKLVRKLAGLDNAQLEADFTRRVRPGLEYAMRMGNLYSASLYLALVSLIDNSDLASAGRIGLFSYGSGCSAEFFSGLVDNRAKQAVGQMRVRARLDGRYPLSITEYDQVLRDCRQLVFGCRDFEVGQGALSGIYQRAFADSGQLVLHAVKNHHREYGWA